MSLICTLELYCTDISDCANSNPYFSFILFTKFVICSSFTDDTFINAVSSYTSTF